jgi:DNA primase
MLMHVEHIDKNEARRILASEVMPRIAPHASELRERLAGTRSSRELRVEMVATQLPEEFEPCFDGERWRVPEYLKARGVSKQAMRDFGLGYCRSGRYASRIVLPVRSLYGRSFTTRLTTPGEPRYLAGDGAGRLLFGWDVLKRRHPGTKLVVLVEGPFDALAVYDAGLPVLGLMGKELRRSQLEQLGFMGEVTFILMLDPEAARDAVEQAGKLLNVRVALLAGQADPADTPRSTLRLAVARAVTLDAARAAGLRRRLRAIRRHPL